MTRFVWTDSWYPDAFSAAKADGCTDAASFGRWCHGTADYWDDALRAAGHESETVIDNLTPDFVAETLSKKPDVICCQNVSRHCGDRWRIAGWKGPLVGFCSYAANMADLKSFDVICTSFPWLVDECKARGIRAEYLPLAFGRSVLDRVQPPARDIPISFVGGLGYRIWKKGTDDIAVLAANTHSFRWFGYRVGKLPPILEQTYGGPLWGKAYFEVLMRSQIVVNRHGEIARTQIPQNMRTFEATGCGACLLTEDGEHINKLFTLAECATYKSPEDLVAKVGFLQDRTDIRDAVARNGQKRTLAEHCYENRVPALTAIVESIRV